jgi:hypothetical protein
VKLSALVVACVIGFAGVRYLTTREESPTVDRTSPEWIARLDALRRARVFVRGSAVGPETPLDTNPRDRRVFPRGDRLLCAYRPKPVSGTTPKFDCELPDGEVVKVKYGRSPEVHAEIAATRLLAALGFAADHVSLVDLLDCEGCPPAPFRTRQIADWFFLAPMLERWRSRAATHTFSTVAVERKFEAPPITAGEVEGWQWSELSEVREDLGGASRADLDALRLIAVVVGHWDNKSSNQRLVCLDRARKEDDGAAGEGSGRCARPLLMLQDLGSTFGPRKLNRKRWSSTPVWADVGACRISMQTMPYDGATFVDATISEAGRRRLAEPLSRLSSEQITSLFVGAAFPDDQGSVDDWVVTLQEKVRQIVDRPACPQ